MRSRAGSLSVPQCAAGQRRKRQRIDEIVFGPALLVNIEECFDDATNSDRSGQRIERRPGAAGDDRV